MAKLSVENLNISQGEKIILRGINLAFESGKLYGILGPNGAGKSTLLKAITNLVKTNSGSIYLDDKDVSKFNVQELAQKVSLMSQSFNIKFPYSVEEIVAMGRYAFSGGHLNKEDKLKIENALVEAELGDIREQNVDKLSGGEKQRVLFGKTLCQDTEVILIDEGFSNMDIYYQVNFIKLLKNKVKLEDKLIIFIMHDLSLAKKYCDEVILLKSGSLYSAGKSSHILNENTLAEVFNVEAKVSDCSIEFF